MDPALVVFIDEIDATRSLPFSTDEFFAGVRECYNRRVQDPALERLTFCLIGVAIPSDLMGDAKLTPFNVGERIVLRDFTPGEAMALGAGLGEDGAATIERIVHWTGGHPFLTQSLGRKAADEGVRGAAGVDRMVAAELFEARARETNINLADVGNRVLNSYEDPDGVAKYRSDVLSLYERVVRGRRVADDESNRLVAVLKLAGLVEAEGGVLRVRNRIYARVFGLDWVRENMPGQELRRQRRAFRVGALRTAALAAAVLAVVSTLAMSAMRSAREAKAALAMAKTEETRAKASEARALTAEGEATRLAVARTTALVEATTAKAKADRLAEERKVALDRAKIAEAQALDQSRLARASAGRERVARLEAQDAAGQARSAAAEARRAQGRANEAARLVLKGEASLRAELYENAVESASLRWERNDRAESNAILAPVAGRKDRGWEWGYLHRLSEAKYVLKGTDEGPGLESFSNPSMFVPTEGTDIIAHEELSARRIDPETGRTTQELWHVPTPKDWTAWRGGFVFRTTFSANGRWAVRRDAKGDFVIQDVARGTFHSIGLPKIFYVNLSISDDGVRVAGSATEIGRTVGANSSVAPQISVWDGRTGASVPVHPPVGPLDRSGSLSPDGQALRLIYRDPAEGRFGMAEYDYTTGEIRRLYALKLDGSVTTGPQPRTAFQVARDGSVVVAHGARIGVFDPGRLEPRLLLDCRTDTPALSISQDGRFLLASNRSTGISSPNQKTDPNLLWDLRTGALVAQLPWSGALVGEDRILLASQNREQAGIDWRRALPYRELQTDRPLRSFAPVTQAGDAYSSRAFDRLLANGNVMRYRFRTEELPNGGYRYLNYVSYDAYDNDGRLRGRYPETGDLTAEASASVSLGDRWLTAWSEKEGFQVRGLPDLRLVRTLTDLHGTWPDISRDGRQAAGVDNSGTLWLWGDGPRPTRSIPTGLSSHKEGAASYAPACALSPDGTKVFAFNEAQGYRVWDLRTLRRLGSTDHSNLDGLRWSPSGKSMIVGSRNRSLDRIDPLSGSRTTILPASDKYSVPALSPDDRLIAVSVAEEVEIRSTRTGRRLFSLDTRREPIRVGNTVTAVTVRALTFSEDGRRLFVLYSDGVLRTYDGGF